MGQQSGRREIEIPVGSAHLSGSLTLPEGAKGVVLFAHGSGSSRFSPRNQFVAGVLNGARLGTLLLDLLTREEQEIDEPTGVLRFDIDLLADRLQAATRWLTDEPSTAELGIGYFGASTGAGAALVAAARLQGTVQAVVSRGGRPDLAREALTYVRAPTLLIVGGNDPYVLELNQEALRSLAVKKRLQVIPGASHLFEEQGTLELVAHFAAEWFVQHLRRRPASRAA